MPHLRYLKYVLLHKLYVFAGGMAIATKCERAESWPRLLWRYLIHDWTKFLPSEWFAYVANFYGAKSPYDDSDPRAAAEAKQRSAAFNRAWLNHQHRNAHHWQHFILRLDMGKEVVLIPEAWYVDEMVADWIGAGTKILGGPTLTECIGLTVEWYMANRNIMQLREVARARVESILHTLAAEYGLIDMAFQVRSATLARQSIVVPR